MLADAKFPRTRVEKSPFMALSNSLAHERVQATPAEAVFKQPLRHLCLVRRRHAAPPAMTNPILRKVRPSGNNPKAAPREQASGLALPTSRKSG